MLDNHKSVDGKASRPVITWRPPRENFFPSILLYLYYVFQSQPRLQLKDENIVGDFAADSPEAKSPCRLESPAVRFEPG